MNASSHPELELGSGKVAEIFHSVDLDGRGVIDYTEFVAACLDHKVEEEEGVCWAAFQVFDKELGYTGMLLYLGRGQVRPRFHQVS